MSCRICLQGVQSDQVFNVDEAVHIHVEEGNGHALTVVTADLAGYGDNHLTSLSGQGNGERAGCIYRNFFFGYQVDALEADVAGIRRGLDRVITGPDGNLTFKPYAFSLPLFRHIH